MMPSSTRLRYLAAVGIVDLVIMSCRCADEIKGMDFVYYEYLPKIYLGKWSNLTNIFLNGLKPPTSMDFLYEYLPKIFEYD